MDNNLPEEVEAYLEEIVKRLTDYLKDQLVGVYLFGSASYDAYESGLSDLDVQAIVKDPLDIVDKQAVICRLNQGALPCPATKLEFVVYAQSAVYPASRHPRFELNLNTGLHQLDHISFDPANEPSHWFLLDIAMGRAHLAVTCTALIRPTLSALSPDAGFCKQLRIRSIGTKQTN